MHHWCRALHPALPRLARYVAWLPKPRRCLVRVVPAPPCTYVCLFSHALPSRNWGNVALDPLRLFLTGDDGVRSGCS